jgi:hypothetical protein
MAKVETNMRTEIGKIQKIHVGFGGYQDAELGLQITLGSDKGAWGVMTFKGYWAMEPSERCEWTKEDQIRGYGEALAFIGELLTKAKRQRVEDLRGVPIEATFKDFNTLHSWRILEEVI